MTLGEGCLIANNGILTPPMHNDNAKDDDGDDDHQGGHSDDDDGDGLINLICLADWQNWPQFKDFEMAPVNEWYPLKTRMSQLFVGGGGH